MSLDEARAAGSVILGLEWQRPNASRYRKLRSGRAGLPEFAVAVAVKDRVDGSRLTAAVWRRGSVSAATTCLGVDDCPDPEAVVAAFPFSSDLLSWERAVVTAEVAGLLPERVFGLVPGSSR